MIMYCMSCNMAVVPHPDGSGLVLWSSLLEHIRTGERIDEKYEHRHRVAPEDLQDVEQLEAWLDA